MIASAQLQSLQQALREPLGSDAIALLLHQDVQHTPVLIYRAPEVVSHEVQAD